MPTVQEKPPFDVVIVTYNSAETLGACLGAVAHLDSPPESLLVIDNASTDDSARLAVGAGATVIKLNENTGFTGGMNLALEKTSAPWVLLLNPDCALDPRYVADLLTAVQQNPENERIGSATGLLKRATGPNLMPSTAIDAAGMVVTQHGRHFDRLAGSDLDHVPGERAWVFGGTGAATLFRREALEDVAYPDGEVLASSFFAYREDAELAWRLQWRNWSCLFVPEAVAAHGRGFRPELGRGGRDHINRLSVRNRFLLRIHCADLGWHLRSFPWWFIRDLLVIGACLTIERSSLPALAEVWHLRTDARRRRRWVLGRATASSRQVGAWFRRPEGMRKVEPS